MALEHSDIEIEFRQGDPDPAVEDRASEVGACPGSCLEVDQCIAQHSGG
jgi:hypothetical protein